MSFTSIPRKNKALLNVQYTISLRRITAKDYTNIYTLLYNNLKALRSYTLVVLVMCRNLLKVRMIQSLSDRDSLFRINLEKFVE